MILDFILLLSLGGFVFFGLWFGFVHTFGALAGTFLSAFIAGRTYEPLAVRIADISGWNENLLRIVIFLTLFVLLNRIIGLIFYIIERAFRFLSFIPFLGTIDHLLGAFLGLLEGIVVLGLTLVVAAKFPVGPVGEMLKDSRLAAWLLATAGVFLPLLPKILRRT